MSKTYSTLDRCIEGAIFIVIVTLTSIVLRAMVNLVM